MSALIERIARPAEEICKICRQNLSTTTTEEKICSLLSCTHLFHQDCLEQWLQRNPTCPMCLGKVERPVKRIQNSSLFPWKMLNVVRNGVLGTLCGLQLGKLITYAQNMLGPSREELFVSGLNCISNIMHLEDYTSERYLDDEILKRCYLLLSPNFWGTRFKEGCLDPLVEKISQISQGLIIPPIKPCTDFALQTEEMEAFVLKNDTGYEMVIYIVAGMALGVFGNIAINHFYSKEKENSPLLLSLKPVYVDEAT